MTATTATATVKRDNLKWAFFAFMGLCALLVIYTDERFLIIPNDHEWTHIAKFKWLLLPHGLAGVTALICGAMQFSDRIRAARPALHRLTGKIYMGAAAITALMGGYIGTHFDARTIYVEEYFHAGLWILCNAMAWACILNKNLASHKLWMMKGYGFALIFIFARLPDAIPNYHMSDQVLADVLWSLDLTVMVAPDVVMTLRDLLRRRARQALA